MKDRLVRFVDTIMIIVLIGAACFVVMMLVTAYGRIQEASSNEQVARVMKVRGVTASRMVVYHFNGQLCFYDKSGEKQCVR